MRLKDSSKILSSFAILMITFAIQFQVFPVYAELEMRSNRRFMKVGALATAIKVALTLVLGSCGVLLFSHDIRVDFLLNLRSQPGAVSLICHVSYCLMILMHVPYLFFLAKENFLVIYDEFMNQSLSTKLELKLAEFVKNQQEAKDGESSPRLLLGEADDLVSLLPQSKDATKAQSDAHPSEHPSSQSSFESERSCLTY